MNKYYFAVTFWSDSSQEVYNESPIEAESYSVALGLLYVDKRITGARLVALQSWAGPCYIRPADLFTPSFHDVPDLTL